MNGHLQLIARYQWDTRFRKPHYCSGNNMSEERREELLHDEERSEGGTDCTPVDEESEFI